MISIVQSFHQDRRRAFSLSFCSIYVHTYLFFFFLSFFLFAVQFASERVHTVNGYVLFSVCLTCVTVEGLLCAMRSSNSQSGEESFFLSLTNLETISSSSKVNDFSNFFFFFLLSLSRLFRLHKRVNDTHL